MKNIISSAGSTLTRCLMLLALCAGLLSVGAQAHPAPPVIGPEPTGTTYIVKPDYRKCAFPLCGGWFLTPVNQYSLHLETEDEAYQSAALLPNSIYISNIDYKQLGLTKEQIAELESAIRSEQTLLRGRVAHAPAPGKITARSNTLVVNGAWVAANKNTAVGPYLNISSTGIVCITTPCPYFNAALINSDYSSQFHDLSLEKAALDREQEAQAWQAISTTGLVITGTTYVSTGFDETGGKPSTGIGIAATKVFFPFPTKK
jgi:hypothetical protein